jgi:hypothetical protein
MFRLLCCCFESSTVTIQLLMASDLPDKARPVAFQQNPPLPEFPIDSLDFGQGLRIPFADLGGADLAKAHGVLRVRAHRIGKRLDRSFRVHKGDDAFYVARSA